MLYAARRIWDPALYQGGSRSRRYFEGWYFKLVDADGAHPISLIPGVSFSEDGRVRTAFVQLVRPGGRTRYLPFPAEAFTYEKKRFAISVGGNRFSRDAITLDLRDEVGGVSGEIRFGPWTPWPVRPLSPGVMGWYRFVPGMECYHGVLSLDHALTGSLEVDGETLTFDGGRGYTEKDWGRSFPSSWIWAQSNHFGREGVSVSASIARIPWMTGTFTGSIAGLLLDGELHRFATYTGARLACVETRPGEADILLRDAHSELELHVHGGTTAPLKAPALGSMEARADEALGASVHVTLRTLAGGRATTRFDGEGLHAGVEIMNANDELGHVRCD
jgi:tocopherol cyclase